MSLNKAELTKLIRDAARRAFRAVWAAHPDEHFYAFALSTDDGWMTVVPSSNSEERFRQSATTPDPAVRAYYRWATAEWAYEAACSDGQEFADVHRLLSGPAMRSAKNDDAESDRQFRQRGSVMIDSMIDALRQLDAEGFFGSDVAREAITLFVSISDSDDAVTLETRSAEVLNPQVVSAAFARRYG